MTEKQKISYFNEMLIRNVDRREEIKNHNKILLEKLLILGKKYKQLKKSG